MIARNKAFKHVRSMNLSLFNFLDVAILQFNSTFSGVASGGDCIFFVVNELSI